MRIQWAPEADVDRQNIAEYIALENPLAALALDELLQEKVTHLADHPGMGRPGRISGTRELVVHQNYILVYQFAGDAVLILRVLHAAQLWP